MLHRETATITADTAGRTITARLCNYDEPRPVAVADGMFTETFERGSVSLADRVHVTDAHTGNLVGRATAMGEDDHGPTVTLAIAPTAAGSDLLALVDAGIIDSVSMEFDPGDGDEWSADRTAVIRHRAVVHGVAFAFRPAHAAPILTRETNTGDPAMTDTVTVMPDTAPVPAVAPTITANVVTTDVLERSMTQIRDDLARAQLVPAGLTYSTPAHPLAEFRSLSEYADLVLYDGGDNQLLRRELVDQITTENPGVMQPAWVSDLKNLVVRGRPLIDAFGTASLPAGGMEINWPYFDGDLLTLVGEQVTEKSPIVSVKVSFKKGTTDITTIAGGSDLSYQLLRRSSPSYKDLYLQTMFASYAAVSDNMAGDELIATPGRGHVAIDPLTADANALRAALFAASLKVETATGSPATFAVASSDVFAKIGGLSGLFPAPYGTNNVAGTADASSLRIDVSGLPIINDPYLPAGSLHVSNRQTASWFEEGPMTIAAEDVEKLGQNVAVWGMAAWAAFNAAGIIQLSATAPTGAAGARRSTKKSDD